MKPMVRGTMVPWLSFFGSMVIVYTVYSRPKVRIISNTIASPVLMPDATVKGGDICISPTVLLLVCINHGSNI